ncbi:hypothetical protein FLAG1_01626 [Fusarium langsethiae]|uniref:Uncharacterized protein n=1 Tax=Fusarium langsethiae TaxID=179993 RepID=A0A0N0DHG4_FUSLA|nr:hypothetical protein FLAG1_01626 [Fusarium langsethiae]GKT99387.1 unnamed protein product [Fusarium langsethiae]GKU19513.1 unnamed protein product [Fusarium langsethiae]
MRLSLLVLLGGAGSAVSAGPRKPSPLSSFMGQADYASTAPDLNEASPNQLKQVFNAFPSINKYLNDFMGMDEYSNAICKSTRARLYHRKLPAEISKIATSGKLVKAGKKPTAWKLVTKWVEETLQTLEKLSIGVELWNNPDVQTIVIRQNRRIHSRFVNIDNNAKNCKQDVAVKNNGTSSFSVNPIVQKAADDLITHMDANNVTLGEMTFSADEQTQLKKWSTRYAPLKTSTYNVSISWGFSYTNLKKRQDSGDDEDEFEDGGSCTLPTSSLTTSTAPTAMSTLSTSYISQTSQEPTSTDQPTTTETEWNGTFPSEMPFIVVDAEGDFTDEFEPFTADQLEDALQDFCDGSRTLISPRNKDAANVAKHYKIGDTSALFISASWTYDQVSGCGRPTADINMGENCKTALRRLKCYNMDYNYGGHYNQFFEAGCVSWITGPVWSSDGTFPGEFLAGINDEF